MTVKTPNRSDDRQFRMQPAIVHVKDMQRTCHVHVFQICRQHFMRMASPRNGKRLHVHAFSVVLAVHPSKFAIRQFVKFRKAM